MFFIWLLNTTNVDILTRTNPSWVQSEQNYLRTYASINIFATGYSQPRRPHYKKINHTKINGEMFEPMIIYEWKISLYITGNIKALGNRHKFTLVWKYAGWFRVHEQLEMCANKFTLLSNRCGVGGNWICPCYIKRKSIETFSTLPFAATICTVHATCSHSSDMDRLPCARSKRCCRTSMDPPARTFQVGYGN